VGELEIALSFPFLQMSWNRRSWKYLTGDLPRPAAFQGRTDALYRRPFFLGGRFLFLFFQNLRISGEDEERESRASALSLSLSLSLSLLRDDTAMRCEEQLIKH